ncbi:hypothetical protein ACQP2T_13505 [Nonomuraea sp. CA-143628]|uniref:hypothetical protein n=1 Tax=Nonomuraea sp. CA-143628 TaxID=3239997 RepID=UPI003D936D58
MTTTDPFAYPAENEGAAAISANHAAMRADVASDLLKAAQGADVRPSYSYDEKLFNYKNGIDAVRDALVGQGHAMLAVRAELADIAGSLRTLAALPGAVQWLADHVTAASETMQGALTDLSNDVCDVHTAIEGSGENAVAGSIDIAAAIREHTETVTEALDNVAEVIDRVRWWQWRRRWTMRRHSKALDARIASAQDSLLSKLDDGSDVEAGLADVYVRANGSSPADSDDAGPVWL